MSDRFGDTVGKADNSTLNFAFMTLEEEQAAGGWDRVSCPTGATPPMRTTTVGMRGEPDIDNDPSFGNAGGV